jgi:hypothetical protein
VKRRRHLSDAGVLTSSNKRSREPFVSGYVCNHMSCAASRTANLRGPSWSSDFLRVKKDERANERALCALPASGKPVCQRVRGKSDIQLAYGIVNYSFPKTLVTGPIQYRTHSMPANVPTEIRPEHPDRIPRKLPTFPGTNDENPRHSLPVQCFSSVKTNPPASTT